MAVNPIPQACNVVKVKTGNDASFTDISEFTVSVELGGLERDVHETFTFGLAQPLITTAKQGGANATVNCVLTYDANGAFEKIKAAWEAGACQLADAVLRVYPGSGQNYIEYNGKLSAFRVDTIGSSSAEPIAFSFTVHGAVTFGVEA